MGNTYDFCKCEQKEENMEYKLNRVHIPSEELVNYCSEKKFSISHATTKNNSSNSTRYNSNSAVYDLSKFHLDFLWKTYDIKFMLNQRSYNNFNDNEIIYSEQFNLMSNFNKNINVNCVVKKKSLYVFKWTSVASSLKIGKSTAKNKINLDPFKTKENLLFEISLINNEIISLEKFISSEKNKENSFIEIKVKSRPNIKNENYVNKNEFELILSSPYESKLNFLICLLSYLLDDIEEF